MPLPSPKDDLDSLSKEELNKRTMVALIEYTQKVTPYQTRGVKPYYNDRNALELRATIDRLLLTREPQFIPLDPSLKLRTRYLQFSQAGSFLRENLDPENFYKRIWPELDIRHNGSVSNPERRGTYITFKRTARLTGIPIPEWRPDFLKYMADCEPGDKFIRINIPISAQDSTFVEERIQELHNKGILFYYEIGRDSINILRYTEDDITGPPQDSAPETP